MSISPLSYLMVALCITLRAFAGFPSSSYYASRDELLQAARTDPDFRYETEIQVPDGVLHVIQIAQGSGRSISQVYVYAYRTAYHEPHSPGYYLAFALAPHSDFISVKASGRDLVIYSTYRARRGVSPEVIKMDSSILFRSEIAAYEADLEMRRNQKSN